MADPNAAAEQHAEKSGGKKYQPRKKTRFLFKLIGLGLVGLAAWYGYFAFKNKKVFNPLDVNDQQELGRALRGDVNKAVDKASPYVKKGLEKAVEYFKYSFEDLKKRMKGKPPETREEEIALVEESQREVALAEQRSKPVSDVAPKPAPQPMGSFALAKAAYGEGSKYYGLAHPTKASHDEIQKNIRLAVPHLEKCLDLCELARKEGANEDAVASLEQSAAQRLYTCRKRMELNIR